jgi:hypothetical protein
VPHGAHGCTVVIDSKKGLSSSIFSQLLVFARGSSNCSGMFYPDGMFSSLCCILLVPRNFLSFLESSSSNFVVARVPFHSVDVISKTDNSSSSTLRQTQEQTFVHERRIERKIA